MYITNVFILVLNRQHEVGQKVSYTVLEKNLCSGKNKKNLTDVS